MPGVSVLMGDHTSGHNLVLSNILKFLTEHLPGCFPVINRDVFRLGLFFEIENDALYLIVEFWPDGTLSYQSKAYDPHLSSHTVHGVSIDKLPYTLEKVLASLRAEYNDQNPNGFYEGYLIPYGTV